MRESKSLPIEIIDNIFQHLSPYSLMECQRVCHLWHLQATRHFMNHVIFRNSNLVFRFLEFPSSRTSTVKKMEIGTIGQNVLSKENIKKLMMKVPNLQELVLDDDLLPLYHLKDINFPTSLTSLTVSYFVLYTTQDIRIFIEILTKLRNTIQKFNMAILDIHDEFFESWDMIAFFSSFPKLIELDLSTLGSINCLADCLPIIQAIPSLKSLKFKSNLEHIDGDLNSATQFKQELGKLEKLEFDAPAFLPQTISFIARHFVGLKKIVTTFDRDKIENLSYSATLLEFLNFIYSLDMYKVRFRTSHEFNLRCLSNTISNAFIQFPENSQNSSRQLHITTRYISYKNRGENHYFELESNRDYCNRLQRKIRWDFQYYIKYHIDELFEWIASLNKINADTFIFDMSDTPFLSRYFDIFFEFLSLLIEPKVVVLRVSNNSEWSKYRPSNQLDHITRLEVHEVVVEDLDHNNMNLSLDMFSRLKMLRLIYYYDEYWYPKHNNYLLDLSLLDLEILQLDVTLLVIGAEYLESEKFMLIIETNSLLYMYEISIASLYATRIQKIEQKMIQTNDKIQLYIKIKSIQRIYLYMLDNMFERLSDITFLSSSPEKMRALISL